MAENNPDNNWDMFWSDRKGIIHNIFHKLAAFYRKFIISESLIFFLDRNYKNDSVLLHAGCGSGLVDEKARKNFKLFPIDISFNALKINDDPKRLVQGDILRIPFKKASFDGIYNFGVMEHFTQSEIIEILKEFNRVLKHQGKIILFWPHEFGIFVILLKSFNYLSNRVYKKNAIQCPDIKTYIKSYSQAESFFKKTDFKIAGYYFGPKDLFTHAVITLEKTGS